jgi:3-phosphoshikimate 1-carboxyvinyltransferase
MSATPSPVSVTLTPPSKPLRGRVSPPGSKSITIRALLLAALAKGKSRLTGALKSDDTARMSEALIAMGVVVEEPDATSFIVVGTGKLHAPNAPLFLGNSGASTRFLVAALAQIDGTVIVDGDEHMRKRPIQPLIAALQSMGIAAVSATGCPPVTIHGKGTLPGGRIEIDGGLSSQYVSALLMLAACANAPVEIALTGDAIGARGYIDLTVAAMTHFGASVEQINTTTWRVQPTGYRAADLLIEPDASAATYLWAAEVLTDGRIDLGVVPDAFTQPDAQAHALIAAYPEMPAIIDGSQMQDAIPTLAVMAAFNETAVRFIGIANLRVKECDRIRALSTGLNRIKPELAREEGDDLLVMGGQALIGHTVSAEIDTYADHRIAMSFALAGLLVNGITINDPNCVAKTYPAYWRDLTSLGVQLKFSS